MQCVVLLKKVSNREAAALIHACFPSLPSSLPYCSSTMTVTFIMTDRKGWLLIWITYIRDSCLSFDNIRKLPTEFLTVIYLNTDSHMHIFFVFICVNLIQQRFLFIYFIYITVPSVVQIT
jgi:hypothetical protein